MKRQVEIFVAGCPLCSEAVQTVRDIACENCEITIYDIKEKASDKAIMEKARAYSISSVPTVVVDGKVLDCCRRSAVDAEKLKAAGVGRA